MHFRRLGPDGPEISVVGMGAWAIGGPWQFGWGPQDDDESLAALHKAFDAGVNWVDTAAVYGLGHSEEVVGQAVREHGGEVLVFTKCGRPWYGRENNEPTYDLRPETIRFELEQSLKRLGTDHVDLYQFHLARRLEPVAERHGVPAAAVAVAWVLAVEGVTAAIVGARRPSQVDGWLPAGDLRLTEADLAGLA
jgi:aryl-alcohol dehydrogenase-like predicted oxidoreductase